MSDRLSVDFTASLAVAGSDHASPSAESIPVAHSLLDEDRVADFSRWIDGELNRLEERFGSFTTRNSLKQSLQR